MRLFPIAAALTLAACGTAQSTQYFVLPDSQYIRPAAHGNEIAVKVNLAEPLANGGLVYQTDAYHVIWRKTTCGRRRSMARWQQISATSSTASIRIAPSCLLHAAKAAKP